MRSSGLLWNALTHAFVPPTAAKHACVCVRARVWVHMRLFAFVFVFLYVYYMGNRSTICVCVCVCAYVCVHMRLFTFACVCVRMCWMGNERTQKYYLQSWLYTDTYMTRNNAPLRDHSWTQIYRSTHYLKLYLNLVQNASFRDNSRTQIYRVISENVSSCECLMGWLRLVGSLKLWVAFADYHLFYGALLQKRPVILSILLTEATPRCSAR